MRRISEEYFALFRRAVEEGEVVIPFDSKEDAYNLRSYLYHFRSQIRKSQPNFLGGEYENLKFNLVPAGLRIGFAKAPGAEKIRKTLDI